MTDEQAPLVISLVLFLVQLFSSGKPLHKHDSVALVVGKKKTLLTFKV